MEVVQRAHAVCAGTGGPQEDEGAEEDGDDGGGGGGVEDEFEEGWEGCEIELDNLDVSVELWNQSMIAKHRAMRRQEGAVQAFIVTSSGGIMEWLTLACFPDEP